MINPKIAKGKTICSTKNLFKVALLIEKPPHIQITTIFPTTGMAVIKLVITVAPHKLI
jgi:hypothetical protein